jgi:hypothetical protein
MLLSSLDSVRVSVRCGLEGGEACEALGCRPWVGFGMSGPGEVDDGEGVVVTPEGYLVAS